MNRADLEAGREFEREFAAEVGGELVPNSGAGWYAKGDVGKSKILWSLKRTGNKTFTITWDLIGEALAWCRGVGGDDRTPAWAIRIRDMDFVLMRKEDFFDLMREDVKIIPPSRSESKRALANRSLLGRGHR